MKKWFSVDKYSVATFVCDMMYSKILSFRSRHFGPTLLHSAGSSFISRVKLKKQNSPARKLFLCQSMATGVAQIAGPIYDSKSEPPTLFDGTTRLYISSKCPYAQRVWIAKNYKGLDHIQLVDINLADRPAWYKEKVYSVNKVPSLEHNGRVLGESLDLLNYFEEKFDGPPIWPKDDTKNEVARELIEYVDTFNKTGFVALSRKDATPTTIEETFGPALDKLEAALEKYAAEGPFFVGSFSVVDIAYAPFIERFHIVFEGIKNYTITTGRPQLARWIDAINKLDFYTQTRLPPNTILETYKKMLENDYFIKVGIVPADQAKKVEAASQSSAAN
ncbi:hypothetical protein O6H91_06G094500 [Diphasiastrum complanatum]|uniref:Uncharacterized protein n=1 Tax=Diphasiastrum complanatum TaxID=34168 RepID=A0ACC2DG71_DIPCM|nr:hypothetical protein O6H91_06G094500 [Diphasiastrum complanatum]